MYAAEVAGTGTLHQGFPKQDSPPYNPPLRGAGGMAVVGEEACCPGGTCDGTSKGEPEAGEPCGYGAGEPQIPPPL
jgi:hypothetical protein